MSEQPTFKYWLDQAVANIIDHYPEGEIVVSSGISPSASYHIGHFREIMTADALAWGIKRAGRQAKHIHVVDNFDPLRRRYDFLPEEYERYVGHPVCLIPDPVSDCRAEHVTYAEHYYREFEGYARQMGIVPDEVVRSYEQLYAAGRMSAAIIDVLKNAPAVRQILEEVSGRELAADWTPVQVITADGTLVNASLDSWNPEAQTIEGVAFGQGRAKLNWRLDWPARWRELGVMVEPFSAQEHGAAGGSYETGVRFSSEIFKYPPPIPGVEYANIHLVGETKKMSSSRGNLITPAEALAIMPAEILRYFVVRSKPDRTLYFDPGQGLFNLLDEFSQIQGDPDHPFIDAYRFAVDGSTGQVVASVPFNHLVTAYQSARGKFEQALVLLARTGWKPANDQEQSVLKREFEYVANWLEKYAPETVKFSLQPELPKVELTAEQRTFLSKLAAGLDAKPHDGEAMHAAIYAAIAAAGLPAPDAFKALYQVLLGKDSGPKAGWFLASLDGTWLQERLQAGAGHNRPS